MRNRTKIILIVVLSLILLLWLASELIIPRAASWYARKEIRKRYPEAGEVYASVRAFPALRLLFRQYGHLKLGARRITLEGINFDSIELESDRWPDGDFTALIGEEEIDHFFSIVCFYLNEPAASIEGDRIILSGTAQLAEGKARIAATGALNVRDGKNVYFEPADIRVNGVPVSREVIDTAAEQIRRSPVFTVRKDLPFIISGVAVESGKLQVKGSVDLEEALDIQL